MTIFRRALSFLYGVMLCGCTHAADSGAPAARHELVIGALLHLTGEMAVQGVAFKEGIELGVDELNEDRSPGTLPIRAVFEDTQYKPMLAATGGKKLLEIDHAAAVLISTLPEAKAAGPVLLRAQVPTVVLWDSAPDLERMGRGVFGIGPWTPSSGEEGARYAYVKLSARRAVVVSTNTEWSLSVAGFFSDLFGKLGGSTVGSFTVNPDESDFRSVLLKLRDLRPDVVYAPVDANIPTFFRQYRSLRIEAPIVTSDIITDDLLSVDADAFEGSFQTMTADLDFPETRALAERYQKRYHRPLTQTSFVAWGYDAVRVVGVSLRRKGVGSRSPAEELHSLRGFKGASGLIEFNERGSAPRPVVVYQVRAGKFTRTEAGERLRPEEQGSTTSGG